MRAMFGSKEGLYSGIAERLQLTPQQNEKAK